MKINLVQGLLTHVTETGTFKILLLNLKQKQFWASTLFWTKSNSKLEDWLKHTFLFPKFLGKAIKGKQNQVVNSSGSDIVNFYRTEGQHT